MKSQLIVFLLFIITLGGYSQTKLKTVTLVPQRNYYLNSGSRMGGVSRQTIKIELPPNTVEWYYSYSTSEGESGTKLLNLGIQLGAAIGTGGASLAVNGALEVPQGSGSADVYLMQYNETYRKYFMEMQVESNWHPYTDYSMRNVKQGVQKIDKFTSGTFYLGVRNPSAFDGINVYIEVVAVVKDVPVADKEAMEKSMLYGNMGWKAYEAGNLDKCFDLSKKACDLHPYAFLKFNMGLVLLAKKNDVDALDYYVDAISLAKREPNTKEVLNAAIEDIRVLKGKQPEVDIDAILELLKEEYNRL